MLPNLFIQFIVFILFDSSTPKYLLAQIKNNEKSRENKRKAARINKARIWRTNIKTLNGELRIQFREFWEYSEYLPSLICERVWQFQQFLQYFDNFDNFQQIPKQFDFLWWFSDLLAKLSITRRTIQFNLFSPPLFALQIFLSFFADFYWFLMSFHWNFIFQSCFGGRSVI